METGSSSASAYVGSAASAPTTISESVGVDTSVNPSTQLFRKKEDAGWDHCLLVSSDNGKKTIKCLYFGTLFKGRGINRMKAHLAKRKGQIAPCKKVPIEVQHQMEVLLDAFNLEKTRKRSMPESSKDKDEVDEGDETLPSQPGELGSSKRNKPIANYFPPSTTPGAQPGIGSAMARKRAIHMAQMAVAKFFYHACIPFNAIKSPYFQEMLDAVGSIGRGFKAPTYHALRGNLLESSVLEVTKDIEKYRRYWDEYGCTIMTDGWTDNRNRTLINFLVYCPLGTFFIKSIDASDESKTADMLCREISKIVEYVGPDNVVQVVTDNAANYVAAGRELMVKYPKMYWTPCAAHCIDLIFEDFFKHICEVQDVVNEARIITRFIYNHLYVLQLLKKLNNGREIIRPGATRFATNFLTLQSIHGSKDALRGMVVSKEWSSHKLSKTDKGVVFENTVLSGSFWVACSKMIRISEPLVVLLRIVDSDTKPSMGCLYEGMRSAMAAVKIACHGKETDYKPYMDIIEARWTSQLRQPIHTAAYVLNPKFFYSNPKEAQTPSVKMDVLKVIQKLHHGDANLQATVAKEMKAYKHESLDFAMPMAITSRELMQPADWWSTYGGCVEHLQRMAVRILSQTCASSGCERNWSVFERVHTKKRNRLEHKRLNDLVYVQHNLHMKHKRMYNKKRKEEIDNMFDPISMEAFHLVEEWVVEENVNVDDVDDVQLLDDIAEIGRSLGKGNVEESSQGHQDPIFGNMNDDEDF